MKEQKNPKKQMIIFYAVTIVLIALLNMVVFPSFTQTRTTSVDYATFLKMVDNGQVSKVNIDRQNLKITFVAKGKVPVVNSKASSSASSSLEDQLQKAVQQPSNPNADNTYVTGVMPDEKLTERLLAKGNIQFTADIPQQTSPLLNIFVGLILPIGLTFLAGWLLLHMMQKKMGGTGPMSFGKSNAKIYVEAQTGKTFHDVAGEDEAKEALVEIVDFLHNPQKYADIGATLPKGALLVGPPGTGKTLLAQAVAGEAHVPFFSISGSEFVEMFVGMGAAKVRDLFKQAQEKAPCIVFIDEIDTIGKARDTSINSNDEREQTLNQLLTEMDGFDGRKGVVILAATNRPDSLDKALLRPGRFDRRIPVDLPDLKGREAILKVHAKDIKIGPDVDYHAVARATAGASGAELANIMNEAALRAVKCGRRSVTQEDMEESVETVIAGYQRKGAVIPPKEKEIIAYHETGHALVAAMQKGSAPVTKITIIPRTSGALGYTMQVDEDEKSLMSRTDCLGKIETLCGGRAAEELIFGDFTSGASNDIEKATKIARAMVTRFGMSSHFGMVAMETVQNQYLGGDTSLTCSPDTAARIDDEVRQIIQEQHGKALAVLQQNMAKLHEISHYLLDRETITGDEFMEILNRKPALEAEQPADDAAAGSGKGNAEHGESGSAGAGAPSQGV
ncbi:MULTISPECIES: ATP-dependent zinc metalloprotease FtsH [Caproicibacterium]|uniref:ATP-dependent zinc metalloprotease FtsH n=1 Tax=Caproicibacterium argilliputei TaxID=3030016 RepID=A0AA97D7B8_9FIRM|nr:ATP-dependent zinc metalloprotease FtsH [Caproicibacterium argilliputei]WOC31601.1 ATP-dependent zinc metalloprotease FtsH [Caproicibacterium argilliputei]